MPNAILLRAVAERRPSRQLDRRHAYVRASKREQRLSPEGTRFDLVPSLYCAKKLGPCWSTLVLTAI
jgi:hypothetical protein